jgi:hypothetical protein
MTWVVHPGYGSHFRILIFYPSRIPDPGIKKAPDSGSRITVLGSRIPDPGSRIPVPGSRFPDPGSATLKYIFLKFSSHLP